MRKRSVASLTVGALCLALVAFAFFSRKPLCIDSKLVERIDRIGESGAASMYRCGLYRQVKFNPKLASDSALLGPRLQKLEVFLSVLGPLKESINLSLIESQERIFKLQGHQIFMSENVLNEKFALEKAILKVWYRERAPQSIFDLLYVEEAVTDLMLFALTGKNIDEGAIQNWPQVLLAGEEYCESPWRSLDHIDLCEKNSKQMQIVFESLRGLTTPSLIETYLHLKPEVQFQTLLGLEKKIIDFQYVRSEKARAEEVRAAAQFIKEWQNTLIRIFPDDEQDSLSEMLNLEFATRGFSDDVVSSYFDWVFQLREQDKALFKELRKASREAKAPKIAVQVGDWVWMLPNSKPIPLRAFHDLRAYRSFAVSCEKPDVHFLKKWQNKTQHLTVVEDCGAKAELSFVDLFKGNIPDFARQNKKLHFMQVHLPSFELALKRGLDPLAVGQLRYHEQANVYESLLPVAPVTWYRP